MQVNAGTEKAETELKVNITGTNKLKLGTMSKLLSQPIFRDSVINGKFAAGMVIIAVMMVYTDATATIIDPLRKTTSSFALSCIVFMRQEIRSV